MSEFPTPEHNLKELDTYMIDGRSLQGWHDWLTTDPDTGEYTGRLECPGSRYGRRSEEVAWWAIAGQAIFKEVGGVEADAEYPIRHLMTLGVNNHPHLAAITLEYWESIPPALKRKLGVTKAEVRRLL